MKSVLEPEGTEEPKRGLLKAAATACCLTPRSASFWEWIEDCLMSLKVCFIVSEVFFCC